MADRKKPERIKNKIGRSVRRIGKSVRLVGRSVRGMGMSARTALSRMARTVLHRVC